MRDLMKPLAALLLCAAAETNAAAATRYISTGIGNDTANDCTVAGTPCATIGHALTQAAGGDLLHVAGGEYFEGNTVTNSGSLAVLGGWNDAFSVQSDDTPTIIRSKHARALGFLFTGSNSGTISLSRLTIRKSKQAPGGDDLNLYGGGLLVSAADSASINIFLDRIVFERNKAVHGAGAAVVLDNAATIGTFYVADCRFSKNKTSYKNVTTVGAGGGLIVNSFSTAMVPTLALTDSVFEKNSAAYGGGIFFHVNAESVPAANELIQRCQFLRNKAKDSGGGIAIRVNGGHVRPIIDSSVFLRNRSGRTGGAISSWAQPGITNGLGRIESSSTNNTINLNRSKEGGGLSIYAKTDGVLDNSRNDHVSTNDIILGNKHTDVAVVSDPVPVATLTRQYGMHGTSETVDATITDISNVSGDPLFVDPGEDIHLMVGSPAIDAVSCAGAPLTDFEKDARPQGAMCDIGADEVAP